MGGYGRQCDFDEGEVFLPDSSRTVGSLAECLATCEATAGCRSVSYFYKSSYCSHVSTACTKTRPSADCISFTKPETTTTTTVVTTTGNAISFTKPKITTTTSTATTTVTTVAITATTAVATTTTSTATTTTGIVGTVQLSDKQCNFDKEVYLQNSPGKVPSLKVCTELCEESSQCKSTTFFSSRFCSHFSTSCANQQDLAGSTVVRLKPRSYTASWSITGGYGSQCDFRKEEVFLQSSSRTVGSLTECLLACEATAGCRSVIFFYKSSYCSHVSTACTKTRPSKDAISFTKPAPTN